MMAVANLLASLLELYLGYLKKSDILQLAGTSGKATALEEA
jgi:hypothetical protein